ncbi:hypothetical protein ABW19_dt0201972 [Dactylella cylindrospora]|nr:hypothetical protein ABW19_dt0201972 [Dactylella cylindrospora]
MFLLQENSFYPTRLSRFADLDFSEHSDIFPSRRNRIEDYFDASEDDSSSSSTSSTVFLLPPQRPSHPPPPFDGTANYPNEFQSIPLSYYFPTFYYRQVAWPAVPPIRIHQVVDVILDFRRWELLDYRVHTPLIRTLTNDMACHGIIADIHRFYRFPWIHGGGPRHVMVFTSVGVVITREVCERIVLVARNEGEFWRNVLGTRGGEIYVVDWFDASTEVRAGGGDGREFF